MVGLILSCTFAGWVWFRPYTWTSEPAARCNVVETLITRDQSYYWVDVHLKVNPGTRHDLQKPVYLETATGVKLEPAESTFAGTDMQNSPEIWFRFWLETAQLQGPLTLHLNDGKLSIKATQGIPELASGAYQNFTNNQW
jgi:hypothetical protein